MELGHFDKHSSTTQERKTPQGKNFWFFRLETLKNFILNENFTHRWPQSGHYIPQIRALFQFLKKGRGDLGASLEEFKEKIKKSKCGTCSCRLCKKIQQHLGFIDKKYGFKKCEFALFYYHFFKKFRNVITRQKNYKVIIENVFSQSELFRVISIKCFSEKFRTLPNFWCWEFCEIIYWILPLNTVLMFDEILNLSLHLPSVDFN